MARQYASAAELLEGDDEAAKQRFMSLLSKHIEKQHGSEAGDEVCRALPAACCVARRGSKHAASSECPRPGARDQGQALAEVLGTQPQVVARLLDDVNRGVRRAVDEGSEDPDASPVAALAAEARAVRPRPGGAADRPEGVTITPAAHFVVKTRDDKGRKVMLNVCGHPQVPAPGDWPHGQARRCLVACLTGR
jgi:hypothetical protein